MGQAAASNAQQRWGRLPMGVKDFYVIADALRLAPVCRPFSDETLPT